jgi:hypothetical protein
MQRDKIITCTVGHLCSAFLLLDIIDCSHDQLILIVRFEVFTAVAMKNGVFWDVTPCGFCMNRRFGGT